MDSVRHEVYVGERDFAKASDMAERIYDHLGPEYFESLPSREREYAIDWLVRTLMRDDLLVWFYDPEEAMLFKLMFA